MAVGLAGARPLAAEAQVDDHDQWVTKLTGKHRQIFDFNAHGDGLGLIHMRNYIETLKAVYGATANDINVVGTFYGGTTPLAWNDAMWAKYKIGGALGLNDPGSKAPVTRNWFLHPAPNDPVFLNGLLPDSSIESLAGKGALFLMCNNAFNLWVGRLASGGLGTTESIRADILANLAPRVVVVPAMVIAIGVAQKNGLTYMRT